MEINVSPKQQFMALEQVASEFRSTVTKESVQTAATYAIAEMNSKGKYTGEQMTAVNDFVRVFFNLGERPPEPKRHPSKSLDYGREKAKASKPRTETI